MSSVKSLYELQEIDLAIRDNKKSISDIEGKLQDDSTLLDANAKLEEEAYIYEMNIPVDTLPEFPYDV